MSIVKRTNSNYTINVNGNDITLESSEVFVTGNLVVQGATTSISTTNTEIEDNVLRLNVGETGSGVTLGFSGVAIDRGNLAAVSLIWNEGFDKWQITTDGTTFANIVTSTGSGSFALVDDVAPVLGGNLNTNQYTISSNVGNLKFGGNIQVNNTDAEPGAVANATVVYASTPAAGTSGIYVVNGSAANQELITKARAFGFSLIL
jgi:hypothetical protein